MGGGRDLWSICDAKWRVHLVSYIWEPELLKWNFCTTEKQLQKKITYPLHTHINSSKCIFTVIFVHLDVVILEGDHKENK